MVFYLLVCLLPAFVISLTTTALMRRWAPKWGLVDQPAARKVHTTPTALGGGIGIWFGVVLPIALAQLSAWLIVSIPDLERQLPERLVPLVEGVLYRSDKMWIILAGGTILATMGLIDDYKNLPWQPRLLIQLAVVTGIVISGVQATVFIPLPWLSILVSIAWMIVLINAFNFLDNMDALSPGIGLISAIMFAVVMLTATSEPRWLVGGVMLILAGSLAGFLCHNWPPARIFMGDSGSYFLGVMLSTMTILGTFFDPNMQSRHVILAPLCILAVPLYDFCSVMLIRLKEGRSPFHPDKSHFSHRLVEIGMQPHNAVLTIHLATLTTGLGALLLYQVRDWDGALLVVALVACVLAIISILETVGRRAGRNTEES